MKPTRPASPEPAHKATIDPVRSFSTNSRPARGRPAAALGRRRHIEQATLGQPSSCATTARSLGRSPEDRSAMPTLSVDLPDSAPTWISAGALLVSLAVALGQYRSYRRRRRDEKAQEKFHDYLKGRARLYMEWVFEDTLFISNSGPGHAHNLRIQFRKLHGAEIPLLVQPDGMELLAAGTMMHPVKLRFNRQVGNRIVPPGQSDIHTIDTSVRNKVPDTIVAHLSWIDGKGEQHASQVLTRH